MGNQTAGGGYHHVGSQRQAFLLLFEEDTIVSAIHRHAAHGQEISESLHLLVYLLGQFAGRCHHDAVDGIFGMFFFGEAVQDGQQVGGRFSCSCLCDGYQVPAFEYHGDGFFLYRGAFFEAHGVERIENTVVQG